MKSHRQENCTEYTFFNVLDQTTGENHAQNSVQRPPSHGGNTRKRKRNSDTWKQNIRKKRRQSGKTYTNSKGKNVLAKEVKTKKDCANHCRFKCSKNFTEEDRKKIFSKFWDLDQTEQKHFINKTTERHEKQRCRTNKGKDSRKSFSYFYHFCIIEGTQIRVCKEFYLTTLDISARRVSYLHETKDPETSVPSTSKWGIHTKKKLSNECKESVRDHINSFPRIESHYCRSVTRKEYFESSLNLQKMYELYQTHCEENEIAPGKLHVYRDIFNHEFNIEFQKPKKDLCDLCYEFNNTINPSEELTAK